jgi:cytosine/uracil/thiamine/allantoin permease
MFILAGWMLYQADFSVIVCPWVFVSSPSAITLFVSIFGSVLGPMFGIMVCDYVSRSGRRSWSMTSTRWWRTERTTVTAAGITKRCLAGASGLMFSVATPALGALDVTVSSICRSVYNV